MTAVPLPIATSGRPAIDVARTAAREAGAYAIERFHRAHDVEVKGRGNLVTETDLEIERRLHDVVQREFPQHGVLSEETAAAAGTDGWVWVIDPIDGTRNFVSGIPYFCINIALCHNGEPAVAVTHDPNRDDTFWAVRGGGAWVNERRAVASQAETVREGVIGIDLGYDDARAQFQLGLARELLPDVQAIRVAGSAALGLAYAAAGRFDVFLHGYLFPWDLAAGILLVQEAGGTITDGSGGPIALTSTTAIAGGAAIHNDLLSWQRDRGWTFDV
jgi:fructose-1,6-bisphosphatase/inositol monophosphatase family enzyme